MKNETIFLQSQEIEITGKVKVTKRKFFKDLAIGNRIGLSLEIDQTYRDCNRLRPTVINLRNLTAKTTGVCSLSVINQALACFGYIVISPQPPRQPRKSIIGI